MSVMSARTGITEWWKMVNAPALQKNPRKIMIIGVGTEMETGTFQRIGPGI